MKVIIQQLEEHHEKEKQGISQLLTYFPVASCALHNNPKGVRTRNWGNFKVLQSYKVCL